MNELDCETSAPGLRLRIQFVMGPSFRGNFLPLFQQAFLLGTCGAAGFVGCRTLLYPGSSLLSKR